MSFLLKGAFPAFWIVLTRLIHISIGYLIGPSSLGYILAPLFGAFGTTHQALFIYAAHMAFAAFTHPLHLITMLHLPTFSGTLFLTTPMRFIRVGIALVCMTLFFVHPIGSGCWYYTLYWLPAVAIGFFPQSSFVLQAVGSTLTTHAVGTVLWLYTHTTTSLFWHTLFYRVWAERIISASLLIIGYYGVIALKELIVSLQTRRGLCPLG